MDRLVFIAKLVESLAWPVTTVVLVAMLRDQIRLLIPYLRSLKVGPIEAVFEQEIEKIKDESDIAGTLPKVSQELEPQREKLLRLADVNPRSAIIEAWGGVEKGARRAAMHNAGSPIPDVKSPLNTIRYLTELKLLDQGDISLFHELRGWRNQAVHVEGFNPSHASAVEYIDLAKRLESRLLNLTGPN